MARQGVAEAFTLAAAAAAVVDNHHLRVGTVPDLTSTDHGQDPLQGHRVVRRLHAGVVVAAAVGADTVADPWIPIPLGQGPDHPLPEGEAAGTALEMAGTTMRKTDDAPVVAASEAMVAGAVREVPEVAVDWC